MNLTNATCLIATSAAAINFTVGHVDAQSLETIEQEGAGHTTHALDKPLYSGCQLPAHRDYHALLSATVEAMDGQFKFSGCGNAI